MDDSQTNIDNKREKEREWVNDKEKKFEEKTKEQNETIKEAHTERIKSARYISNECFDGFICWNNMKNRHCFYMQCNQRHSTLIANILI